MVVLVVLVDGLFIVRGVRGCGGSGCGE